MAVHLGGTVGPFCCPAESNNNNNNNLASTPELLGKRLVLLVVASTGVNNLEKGPIASTSLPSCSFHMVVGGCRL